MPRTLQWLTKKLSQLPQPEALPDNYPSSRARNLDRLGDYECERHILLEVASDLIRTKTVFVVPPSGGDDRAG